MAKGWLARQSGSNTSSALWLDEKDAEEVMQIQYKWWLIPIASVALTGCLKQLGLEADDDKTGVAASAISGKAADGYLQGAVVCFDINENKACDPGEPQTETGAGGAFTISATAEQASHPLVVEIIAGETIDEDNPDTPIAEAYTLSAPPGYTFVSPLTTLVQNELESSGGSVDDAEAAIKTLLGTSLDLSADYVAGADDEGDTQAGEFERLHKVAQVTATLIRTNLDEVSGVTGISFSAKLELITAKVTAALENIVQQVEDAGDSFDPDAIAQSDEIEALAAVSSETIADEIEVAESVKDATSANMGEALAGGVYWLEERVWFDYGVDASKLFFGWGSVSFDENADPRQETHFYFYNGGEADAAAFTEDVQEGSGDDNGQPDYMLHLTADGWQQVNMRENDGQGPVFDSVNTDGSVNMLMGPIKVKLTADEIDVSTKNIAATLANTRNGLWADAVDETAVFPANSTAYRIHETLAEDVYLMPWSMPASSLEEYSDCSVDDAVGGTEGNESCNSVRYFNGANIASEPLSIADDAVSLAVGSASSSLNTLKGIVLNFEEDSEGGMKKAVVMELVNGGTVNYYLLTNNNGSFSREKIRSDKFTTKSLAGKSLVMIPVPFDIPNHLTEKSEGEENDGPDFRTFFLSKEDGYWRFGIALTTGQKVPDDAPFVMNETAKNAVIAAFDVANINNFIDPVFVEDGDDSGYSDDVKPCFNGDSENHDKTYQNYLDALNGCRPVDEQGEKYIADDQGGFTAQDVEDMTFDLPDGESISFTAGGEFTLYESDETSESGSWEIDGSGFLIVTLGEDERVVIGIVDHTPEGLSVKHYLKDIDSDEGGEDDGFSADLGTTGSDADVFSMLWRADVVEEEPAP